MKNRTIFLIWILTFACVACEKDEVMRYDSADNIYFDFDQKPAERDSILYTFAYTPDIKADTVFLPVSIAGKRVSVERHFKLTVVPDSTTARSGIHYEPLQNHYTIPADSGSVHVPFIMYNTDTTLQNTSVTVFFALAPSEDFGTALSKLTHAKVVFSNRLEKPVWWDFWTGELGTYSRVKHDLYLISVGNVDLIPDLSGDNGMKIPFMLYSIDKLRRFLRDPFSWTAENQDGYVLTERTDGNYDFYHSANPSKTFLLQLNKEDGKYYFINENGLRVTVN